MALPRSDVNDAALGHSTRNRHHHPGVSVTARPNP